MDLLRPEWSAPARVKALVTTRPFGDMGGEERTKLRALLPGEPAWLHQVHGVDVMEAAAVRGKPKADASVTQTPGAICVVMAADCMPVLLCDEDGTVVGAAHAGWRGLCAGVIEATVSRMKEKSIQESRLLAWLGPAIGPRAYEVGDEVRDAFLARDGAAAGAFSATRPGHWLLDLYTVARQRLQRCGVTQVSGGGFCTHSEPARFFSYRRDATRARMAALIWLT
jgi:polyphenol oxidase